MSYKKLLIANIKYSKFLYNLYYFIGSGLLYFLRLFIHQDEKLILFSSFGGKKYDDSPRAIYEKMINDKRFNQLRIVWAFMCPQYHEIPVGEKVVIDSIKFYKLALKARIWVTNSSMERGLSFKHKKTFCLNTWHGTPIKKMGSDVKKSDKSFRKKGKNSTNIMLAQSKWEADIFSQVFKIPSENFRITGLPRNDILANYTTHERLEIRKKLGIPKDKKVILYAPTFREYNSSSLGVKLVLPINFKKWEDVLHKKGYFLLFRAHYEVSQLMTIKENNFVHNMSDYPVLDDLMIASDILISDYSSILFDYSIMDKPMICFCYDFDKYEQERGMYFDIRDYLDHVENEDDLLSLLLSIDTDKSVDKTIKFRNRFVTEYGEATSKTLDIISKELNI